MKRNLKWKERLGALLLAVLFVMQAILSFLPMDMVQAAAKGIEIWQTDQTVDYGYRFNMKSLGAITRTGMLFLIMEEATEMQKL